MNISYEELVELLRKATMLNTGLTRLSPYLSRLWDIEADIKVYSAMSRKS